MKSYTQKQFDKEMKHLYWLEIACIIGGLFSTALLLISIFS